MTTRKGDIIVCSKNVHNGVFYNIMVGDQFLVIDEPYDVRQNREDFKNIVVTVRNIKTNRIYTFVPDKLFISLQVWRDFKLSKILEK